jgi:hypothetical protein
MGDLSRVAWERVPTVVPRRNVYTIIRRGTVMVAMGDLSRIA